MFQAKSVSYSLGDLIDAISSDAIIELIVQGEKVDLGKVTIKDIKVTKLRRLIDVFKSSQDSSDNYQDGVGYLLDVAHRPNLSEIAVLLVPNQVPHSVTQIVCKDPFAAFYNLVPLFYQEINSSRAIDPSSTLHKTVQFTHKESCSVGANVVIGENCLIGRNVTIHPNVVIGPGVSIGDKTVIHSRVSIHANVQIGSEVMIQSGAVIGSIGFGYRPDEKGDLSLIPHLGTVIIEDRVHIGANTCIDRGVIGNTVVGYGSKIDNLVQIGHNNIIGKHVIMCGQVGIAGSCTIGDRVTLGGKAGVADHKAITSGARIGGYSGVTKDITEKGDYAGFPARPYREWLKLIAKKK